VSKRGRTILAVAGLSVGLAAILLVSRGRPAEARALVTVYKSPTCECCLKWVEHMRASGFQVETVDVQDVTGPKTEHGVPVGLHSCHTAVVGGYVVEGHVPADVVRQMLRERPAVAGIAVPGMSQGSPGMEGPSPQRYNVVAFDSAGGITVYARR